MSKYNHQNIVVENSKPPYSVVFSTLKIPAEGLLDYEINIVVLKNCVATWVCVETDEFKTKVHCSCYWFTTSLLAFFFFFKQII